MTRCVWALLGLLAPLVTFGCSPELTEVIIVVDSDLDVPDELDTAFIEVKGPTGDVRQATARLDGERGIPLPRTLGVVHRGGPLEPLDVLVEGRLGRRAIIQRHARTGFVEGETRVLRMWLLRSCVGKMCDVDETCTEQGCRSQDVSPEDLERWTGQAHGLDASTNPDAGDGGVDGGQDGCVPMQEVCNELDDDCDGMADEDFDLSADPLNCGGCGVECELNPDNGASECGSGECVLSCDPGWGDCNELDDDGCESLLSDPAHCGDCDTTCADPEPFCSGEGTAFSCASGCGTRTLCGGSCVNTQTSPQHCGECDNACPSRPHASPACESGSCGYVCDTGWHDCDGAAANGCESQLRSLGHCGACGRTCDLPHASETCTTGTCRIVACDTGYGDCNGDASDGCETSLSTDVTSCGACGNACPVDPPNASSTCDGGGCRLVCDAGFADCDGDAANGCEASLSSTETCGSCGIRCTESTPVCATDGAGGYVCVAELECSGELSLCSDSCVDTRSDPSHCGGCDQACPDRPNSSPTCNDGSCGISCDSGWADCNDREADGCETNTDTSRMHCGACGSECGMLKACCSGSCTTGVCL